VTTETTDPLCLVLPITIPGRPHLLPLEGAESRGSLGLRPMALSEAVKEADRPCFAILSDDDDLLARGWQLAGRCGLRGSNGAITPMALPLADGTPGPIVNGILLSGPESGFEKMYEVLALSGDPAEGRLARAGERVLAPPPARDLKWHGGLLRPARIRQGGRPLVMAILNVTPDSFSDGGRFAEASVAIERGRELADQGADILDIGGESTRPGAEAVGLEEESARVMPVIEGLAGAIPIPMSIDTTKSEVARRALAAGAAIINDISGMTMDPMMAPLAAGSETLVILNHIRGLPRTMQESPDYRHVVLEVLLDLASRVRAVRAAGVDSARIIIDPGIGFGKRVEDNLSLLRHLGSISSLGSPVMVGVSRKSFLGALTGRAVAGRGAGTAAAEAIAALAGAEIIRTHDPAGARDAIAVAAGLAGGS
jgi:dihydropteroate synthase